MYDVTDNNSSQTTITLNSLPAPKQLNNVTTKAQTHKTYFPKNISKKLPMERNIRVSKYHTNRVKTQKLGLRQQKGGKGD